MANASLVIMTDYNWLFLFVSIKRISLTAPIRFSNLELIFDADVTCNSASNW